MTGNTGSPFVYEWAGNPTAVSIKALNPPQGALVIDNTTGNWYRKVSAGDNSSYAAVSDSVNSLVLTDQNGHTYQLTVNSGALGLTQLS